MGGVSVFSLFFSARENTVTNPKNVPGRLRLEAMLPFCGGDGEPAARDSFSPAPTAIWFADELRAPSFPRRISLRVTAFSAGICRYCGVVWCGCLISSAVLQPWSLQAEGMHMVDMVLPHTLYCYAAFGPPHTGSGGKHLCFVTTISKKK
eukprot:RCo052025